MTALETMATIFAVAILVKLAVVVIDVRSWYRIVGPIYKHQNSALIIYLITAAITGYYIFTNLDIIDIAAIMLFTSLLMGIGFVPYSKTLLKLKDEVIRAGISKSWPSIVIWVGLAVATLYAVLF